MPYRSLKQADLRPLSPDTRRTIPRFALVLTLAAQVIVWGTLIVASYVVMRPFQEAATSFELELSAPVTFLVRLGEVVRAYIGWLLAALLVLLCTEVYHFVKRRPFHIRHAAWLSLMIFSLMLPFLLMLVGGMLVLQAWAKLIATLG